MLEIIQYPSELLRRKGRYVENLSEVKEEIQQMLDTLKAQENCAALAATQLSIPNPHRIVVFNIPDYKGNNEIWGLINPVILEKIGTQREIEGCMSIPEVSAEVIRAETIKVKGLDLNGEAVSFIATNFLARCIQHEVDHLKGVLYLDHLDHNTLHRLNQKINQKNK